MIEMAKINFLKYKNKKVLLLCHENADLDAISAAAILKLLLLKKQINSEIGVPSHINEQAKHFAQKEKIKFIVSPDLKKYDQIFLLDFNDYEQLGQLREKFTLLQKQKSFSVISFDHHVVEKTSIDSSKIGVSKKHSTTQVLLDFFKKDFDKKMFFYACIGMIEDTGHFIVGDKKLFNDFSICLSNSNKNYSEVLTFTKNEMDKGKRLAFLKAAKRAEIFDINDFVIVFSNVSFFQGAAATKLLSFGADVALVYGENEKNGECILSCRADSYFKEKNNFNLVDDLLIELQNKLGGEIGGHSGAAMWKGKASEEFVKNNCLEILRKITYKK